MFYCGLLAHDDFVEPALDERDLSEYAPHVGNVRSALGWAFSEAGSTAIGVELAGLAAPLFTGLSLLEECREWCKRALALLDDATRGTQREMMLQEALALSTMYTEGHNDDVRQALERGLGLADSFQDRIRQLRLLAGLNMFYLRLGDIDRALAVAERGAGAAQLARYPAGIAWSECWIGNARHFLGDQTAAHLHCLRSLDLSAQLGRSTANFFGFDQRVRALVNLARALLLRGFADQARGAAQDAMDEAASRNHPVSVCFAQAYAALLLLWTGDVHRADELIDQLMASSARYSLEPYRALGLALKGELAIIRNDPETGLDLLRSALGALRTQHYRLVETLFLCAFAEGLYRTGQFEKALAAVDGGIARAATSGMRFDLPELLRIKSQLLSKQGDRVSAMPLLIEAIAVARDQSALALELRSTMSLARMLAADGQRAEARLRLAQVYDTFTEGFETADLTEAGALLKDLQ
jgi:tetratricopeptide (TPR) repeat protein